MPSTTIKLDAESMQKVESLMAKDESVSAFVRRLIDKEHLEQANMDAAGRYLVFLGANPNERASL